MSKTFKKLTEEDYEEYDERKFASSKEFKMMRRKQNRKNKFKIKYLVFDSKGDSDVDS